MAAAGFAGRVEHRLRGRGGGRERLLADDVLAGFDRRQRMLEMG